MLIKNKRKVRSGIWVILLLTLFLLPKWIHSGFTLVESTEQPENPILFLHGWWVSSYVWDLMRMRLKDDGWPNTTDLKAGYVIDFKDTTNCSAQANIINALQIKQTVDNILDITGAQKVDLIAFSMGGWSSRYYIKNLEGIDKVDDYVSIGTAHHCDYWAEASCDGIPAFLLALNEGDATPGGILNDTLEGRTDPQTKIVFNGSHIPGEINYTSINSIVDIDPVYAYLDGAYNLEVDDVSHEDLLGDENVYELVKQAIRDSPSPPNNVSSFLLNSVVFALCVLVLPLSFWRKRKTIM